MTKLCFTIFPLHFSLIALPFSWKIGDLFYPRTSVSVFIKFPQEAAHVIILLLKVGCWYSGNLLKSPETIAAQGVLDMHACVWSDGIGEGRRYITRKVFHF